MDPERGRDAGAWARAALHLKALLLLTAAAILVYLHLYLPARDRRLEADARVERLQQEVRDLRERCARLEMRRDALEAGDRNVVEEAIRSELGWGRAGERAVLPPADAFASSPDEETPDEER